MASKRQILNCVTENYRWLLGGSRKGRNGVALVIRKHVDLKIRKFWHQKVGDAERLCHAYIEAKHRKFLIVCVHIPPNLGSSAALRIYSKLSIILNRDAMNREVVILGDFNGHIGRDARRPADKLILGPNIFHEVTNELGSLLLSFAEKHDLTIASTYGARSAIYTWFRKEKKSQLDHVLLNCRSFSSIGKVKGYVPGGN